MAILIEPPVALTTWTNLSQKPTILTDNQIDWNEIANKPATFPFTPFWGLEFAENSVNYLDFHVQGVGKASMDYDARISASTPTSSVSNGTAILQYTAGKHYFYGNFLLFGLPTSSTGVSGQIWKDSNGFLRG